MPDLVVIDTTVLQKANAPYDPAGRQHSKFAKRIALLRRVRRHELTPLISAKLQDEYRRQVPRPRNDFVRVFFELLARPDGAIVNWCEWSGKRRDDARHCRFPSEDYHVLRTAVCDRKSAILCEEHRMLVTDACIHRRFGVHVMDPTV